MQLQLVFMFLLITTRKGLLHTLFDRLPFAEKLAKSLQHSSFVELPIIVSRKAAMFCALQNSDQGLFMWSILAIDLLILIYVGCLLPCQAPPEHVQNRRTYIYVYSSRGVSWRIPVKFLQCF